LLTYFREKDWAENDARNESQMLDNKEDKIDSKGRSRRIMRYDAMSDDMANR